jgi:hypothetical protein
MASDVLYATAEMCRSGSWGVSVLQSAEKFALPPFQDRRAACVVLISPSMVLVAKTKTLDYLGGCSTAQYPA